MIEQEFFLFIWLCSFPIKVRTNRKRKRKENFGEKLIPIAKKTEINLKFENLEK